MLTDDPTEYAQSISAKAGTAQTLVIGFQDDREALLTGMEWVDPVRQRSGPADPQRPGRHQHHQPGRAMAADRDVGPETGQ